MTARRHISLNIATRGVNPVNSVVAVWAVRPTSRSYLRVGRRAAILASGLKQYCRLLDGQSPLEVTFCRLLLIPRDNRVSARFPVWLAPLGKCGANPNGASFSSKAPATPGDSPCQKAAMLCYLGAAVATAEPCESAAFIPCLRHEGQSAFRIACRRNR